MKSKVMHATMAILPFLIACFFLPLIQLPAADLDPQLPLTQYGIDTWDGSDGLPQIRIRAIVQTRDGYLWLGTASGLSRFDGVNFTTFGTQNGSLKDNEVSCLQEDDNGALWIGTWGGGLTRYQKGQFTTFTTADGLPDDSIRRLDKDREGNLWIATPHGLGSFCRGKFTTYTTRDGLPNNFINSISAGSSQGIFAAAGGWLSRFDGGKFVLVPGVVDGSDGRLDTLTSGKDGALWMTFESSKIKCWRDGQLTVYTAKDHKCNRPGTIYADPQGTLWIGARDGLHRFCNGTFDVLATPEARSKLGVVLSMLADREGNLWLGTEANGLARLRSVPIHMLTAEDGLSESSTRCIYRDRQGDIWIGAYLGFSRLSHGELTAFTQLDGNPISAVTSIGEDAKGRLWVAAGGRLLFMENERLTPVPGWTNVFDIKVIARDNRGDMWIGTDGDGLFRFADDKMTTIRTRDGLPSNQIRAILNDRQGALWVGTTAGLSRYQDGKFTNFNTTNGLGNDRVMSLYEDGDGVLWVATRGGLSRYQDGRFFNIRASDGLPDNYIFNVLDDGQGGLWLSNGKGICRARKDDLNALAAGKMKKIDVLSLGYRDGLRTTLLVAGTQPNACIGEAGQLFFCSLKGLVVVNPDRHAGNRYVPPVFIEQVLINRQIELVDRPPNPSSGSGEVEIHYTALSYVAPEKVRFKYQLEGMDAGWVDAGQRRFAHYASLPPGSYQFRVIACNNDGVWNQTGATYAFQLNPHFYQTKWFPILVLGLLIVLVGGGYLIRIHRLQARERELQRRVDEAVAQVKVLSGLLPICGGCKKIRDDKGYWNQIESYIMRHADIEFSHGLCPDCLKRLYPDCADEVLDEMKAAEGRKRPKPDPS